MKSLFVHKKINQNNEKKLHDLIIRSFNFENYFFWKLYQYLESPQLCLLEYNLSCGEFLINNLNNSIIFIKNSLGTNKENWKWKNLNIKHFTHIPFSMVPVLKNLFHKTIKSDVKYYYYSIG